MFTLMVLLPVILAMVPYIIHLGPVTVSDEPWLARLISYAISGREDAFRDGVRARDMKWKSQYNGNLT